MRTSETESIEESSKDTEVKCFGGGDVGVLVANSTGPFSCLFARNYKRNEGPAHRNEFQGRESTSQKKKKRSCQKVDHVYVSFWGGILTLNLELRGPGERAVCAPFLILFVSLLFWILSWNERWMTDSRGYCRY